MYNSLYLRLALLFLAFWGAYSGQSFAMQPEEPEKQIIERALRSGYIKATYKNLSLYKQYYPIHILRDPSERLSAGVVAEAILAGCDIEHLLTDEVTQSFNIDVCKALISKIDRRSASITTADEERTLFYFSTLMKRKHIPLEIVDQAWFDGQKRRFPSDSRVWEVWKKLVITPSTQPLPIATTSTITNQPVIEDEAPETIPAEEGNDQFSVKLTAQEYEEVIAHMRKMQYEEQGTISGKDSETSVGSVASATQAPSKQPVPATQSIPQPQVPSSQPRTWQQWCERLPWYAQKTICVAVLGVVSAKLVYNKWFAKKPVEVREDFKITIVNDTGMNGQLTVRHHDGSVSITALQANATWSDTISTIAEISFATKSAHGAEQASAPLKLGYYKKQLASAQSDLVVTIKPVTGWWRFWYRAPYRSEVKWQQSKQ